MQRKHNKRLTPVAKMLRKNMTAQERKLWYEFLRAYPVRMLRQKVIDRFVVDFYCPRAKVVIELDGGQHFSAIALEGDERRSEILRRYGLKVIRFSNLEVEQNFTAVCEAIEREIEAGARNPSAADAAPPFGKGGKEERD